jgi:cytoskeleton protein RodZ
VTNRNDRKGGADDAAGPAATDLGAMLREVRVARGMNLREAASALRIRVAYLEAIESGRFKDLPGSTYAAGFLRAYADYLGIDGDDAVGRLKDAMDSFNRPATLVLPSPAETGHMPTGSVFLVAAIIAIAAYGGWYYLSVEGRDPGEFIAGVPQRITNMVSKAPAEASRTTDTTAPATPDSAAATPTEASQSPAQLAATTPTETTTPSPAPSPTAPDSAGSTTNVPEPSPPPERRALPVASAPGTAGPAPAATSDRAPETAIRPLGRLVLRATADTWVELRAPGQSPVFSRVLRRGESYDVPSRDDLALTTGNAGGIEIVIDGRTLPPLGPSGAVQRNVALNPDQLSNR